MRVVFEVIYAKTHRAGREIRQIGQDRNPQVKRLVPKDQIMRGVMDNDVVGVIGERADEIGN